MKFLVYIVLLLISFSLLAQNPNFKNQEFSFTIGAGELDIEKFLPGENLDFINYFDTDPEYTDFIIVKLGYKFDFFSKMTADIKLILMDDIIPDNYDFSVHYFLKPWLGIGVGSMLNKNYITYFENYHMQTFTGYYLVDDNVQQFTTYDLGFYLSPALKPIDGDLIKLLVKCDFGLSSLMKEETTFYHKKKLSNERLRYHYETKTTFQPYIQPKIELRLRAFKIKQVSLGILLNSGYYHANRSIDYLRTLQEWTMENIINVDVKSPKHNYSRFEFDMGIFMRW
ncbi:MAG: hypothetical protein JXB00_04725 [Bacteroidales bacterium]|nr:hypothetical protein [Bacteroidales bacterium]